MSCLWCLAVLVVVVSGLGLLSRLAAWLSLSAAAEGGGCACLCRGRAAKKALMPTQQLGDDSRQAGRKGEEGGPRDGRECGSKARGDDGVVVMEAAVCGRRSGTVHHVSRTCRSE